MNVGSAVYSEECYEASQTREEKTDFEHSSTIARDCLGRRGEIPHNADAKSRKRSAGIQIFVTYSDFIKL